MSYWREASKDGRRLLYGTLIKRLTRSRAPTPMQLKLVHIGRFCIAVLRRFDEDDGFRLCGSLAYTSLLALVPLVTVGLAAFAAFPAFTNFTEAIQQFFANNLLPATVAQKVLTSIDEFTSNAARLTALGVMMIAVTAFMLMATIERAFNMIWRVRRGRSVVSRILVFWCVMTLGPILVGASLTLTAYAVSRWLGPASGLPWITDVFLFLIPVGLMAVAFTLLYMIVPSNAVEFRHAAIGGVAAAFMFELVKRGFTAYISHFPSYTMVYGALAVIPIFLVWLYLLWVVTILGAQIAALAPDYRYVARHGERPAVPTFRATLGVLRVLVMAQRRAESPSTRRIANESQLPSESVDAILSRLAEAGIVGAMQGGRWALVVDPHSMSVGDLYHHFALAREAGRAGEAEDVFDALIAELAKSAQTALQRPLSSLAPPASEPTLKSPS